MQFSKGNVDVDEKTKTCWSYSYQERKSQSGDHRKIQVDEEKIYSKTNHTPLPVGMESFI